MAKYPKINLGYKGYQIPSLLDAGNDMTLLQQSYFKENQMHLVRAHSGEKIRSSYIISFNSSKLGAIADYMMCGTGFKFYGTYGTQSWNLSHKRSKPAPGPKTSDKITRSSRMESGVPSLQGVHKNICNYNFYSFHCPSGVNLLFFSQLCVYYYTDVSDIQTSDIHTVLRNTYGHDWPSNGKKTQKFPSNKEGILGKVLVGGKQKPWCIPATQPSQSQVQQNTAWFTCLVEHAAKSNLPFEIVVNRCLAHLKAKSVPVILVNTKSKSV